MDILIQLIERYGPYVGLAIIVTLNYMMIRRSSSKSEDKAKDAATEQQKVITKQFTDLAADNRRLQARIDALETAADQARAASMVMATELNEAKRESTAQQKALTAAQEKAAQLEIEVKTLTEKVAALETERAQRSAELERERTQVQTTKRELKDANEKIAQLQQRVSVLEGENSAFRLLLDKLDVVKVEPPADGDKPSEPAPETAP